ncbi:unnamed protein product [Bursaphelenchus okinawaensis]|uniref:Uncharacterized protein n=1 Tax=Bursaphelenchus okinawaensis TaxID=465554 RepID=A0A811LHB2_9BILA|nr:unnamed protein product [Bursaphelenchus okinawaensis]CAG9123802.1 unnamed protein product [Bursaphelenchus okinawaensis]
MKFRPTVHFTILDESSDTRSYVQVSTLTAPNSTVLKALHDVLNESGMSVAEYDVIKTYSNGKNVKYDTKVKDHQDIDVVIRRKRHKNRPKGKKVAPMLMTVVRTVIEEIVDEIKPPKTYFSEVEEIGGPIATTSSITVHLRVKTVRPETIDLVDEYPWVKLSSSPWHITADTTAVQFVTQLVKKGFLNELMEFKLVDSDGQLQDISMNSLLKNGAIYSAVAKKGVPRELKTDAEMILKSDAEMMINSGDQMIYTKKPVEI